MMYDSIGRQIRSRKVVFAAARGVDFDKLGWRFLTFRYHDLGFLRIVYALCWRARTKEAIYVRTASLLLDHLETENQVYAMDSISRIWRSFSYEVLSISPLWWSILVAVSALLFFAFLMARGRET